MAKRKNKSRSRRRSPGTALAPRRRRSMRRSGKRSFKGPTVNAAKYGAAMAAGALLIIFLENRFGIEVPDVIPAKAAGFIAFLYWFGGSQDAWDTAFGLIGAEAIEGTEAYINAMAQAAG